MSECAVAKTSEHDVAMEMSNDKTLFEPTVEMMVNDYDDERTLDEEEALAAGEQQDPRAELNNLRREGDMPLEELLAMYGVNKKPEEDGGDLEDQEEEEEEGDGEGDEEVSELQQLYSGGVSNSAGGTSDVNNSGGVGNGANSSGAPRLLRSGSRPPSEEEDDCDYSPEEDDWKKTIMVGSDYQAWIPEGLSTYGDALPYENEDKLLWNPGVIGETETEDYMLKIREIGVAGSSSGTIPVGSQVRDDEQALFLLQQCGHNVDEALRRTRMTPHCPAPPPPHLALWSEEECRNFENGLKAHGKDFRLIQQHKVRTRSVGELVQFYYIWKKTERHDMFANKSRLIKTKYTLHPGHMDYMDRFLEEQEDNPPSVTITQAPATVLSTSAPPPDPLAVGKEVFSELPAHSSPPQSPSDGHTSPL